MAAGRKTTAPKRPATTGRRGRPPGKAVPPKAAGLTRAKTPTRKTAQKATPSRPQPRQASSRRTASQADAGLTAQLEAMAQALGQIREARAELKDLRRLVEALTGMVEGLVAAQRGQGGEPAQEPTAEARRAPAEGEELGAAADQPAPRRPAESTPAAPEAVIGADAA